MSVSVKLGGNAQYMNSYVKHETGQQSDRRICSAKGYNSAHVCSNSSVTTKINYSQKNAVEWPENRKGTVGGDADR